ncbi:MAG TPA: hypothetical protein VH682_25115 [Gemmataceae bacterium]|jgi:hypothetical protein
MSRQLSLVVRRRITKPRTRSGPWIMDKQLHQQAVKDIASFTGCVDTDERLPGHPVVGVNLDRSLATDSVLGSLKNLVALHYLKLSQTRVTDKIMEVLRVHPEIKRLDISDTGVTDIGLKYLKYGKALEELYLGSKITDAGFRYVKSLTKLRVLALEFTDVSDLGLRNIQSLVELECLFVSSRQVSNTSIRCLKKLPRLQTIQLLAVGDLAAGPALSQLKESLPNVRVEW